MEDEVAKKGYSVVQSGYADAPPWKSDPAKEQTNKAKIPFSQAIAKILFKIWIPIMERFYRKSDVAHVVYCFGMKSLNQ